MYKVILTVMVVFLLLLSAISAYAFVEVRPDILEVDGKMLGKAVNEIEMDGMRGGYMGYSFSVVFQGWWDSLGNASALLQGGGSVAGNPGTTANASGAIPTNNLPANTAVNIQATVGNMGAAKGIFQITQVPGSNNLVNNTLNVNINIIQVLGNSLSNLPNMLGR